MVVALVAIGVPILVEVIVGEVLEDEAARDVVVMVVGPFVVGLVVGLVFTSGVTLDFNVPVVIALDISGVVVNRKDV